MSHSITTATASYEVMDLDDLMAAINREHCGTIRAAKTTLDHAMRCGDLLAAAKAKVPHGGWGSWIVENTDFTTRTASNYMKLASNRKSISEMDHGGGVVDVIKLLNQADSPPAPSSAPPPSSAPAKSSPLIIDAEIILTPSSHDSDAIDETEPLFIAIKKHRPEAEPDPIYHAVDRLIFALLKSSCGADYIHGLAGAVLELEGGRA